MATIALVEDDETARRSIRKMIEFCGHTVIEFDDPAPFLESIAGLQVDAIVTDLQMDTPGETLILALKDRDMEIPIIVMTGQGDFDTEHLMTVGVEFFLFKPFELGLLQTVLKECLNQHVMHCKK